jgi:hypothetical protein
MCIECKHENFHNFNKSCDVTTIKNRRTLLTQIQDETLKDSIITTVDKN